MNENQTKTGVIYAILAFLIWGILPLFWKLLQDVHPLEILMHRILWSFTFSALLLSYKKQWKQLFKVFSDKKQLLTITLAAVLVSINWGIYIWAVNASHVVDTSLGYYINPLLSVCLGMLVLKERLDRPQIIALVLAFCGVVVITFQYGKIPWISLSLAATFGLYGLVKKVVNIDSVVGLTLETLLLLPFAVGFLVYREYLQLGAFAHPPLNLNFLLIAGGIVTALPLLWFARATQLIPLSSVGFIQYLTPTMMLIIGIFLFNEPFSSGHLVGFALIWIALALYSFSELQKRKRISSRSNRSLN